MANRLVRTMNKSRTRCRAQATLESTVTLIIAVILLLGITQVFIWMNKIMIERHQAFRSTRRGTQAVVNFYTPEEFDIFEIFKGQ